MALGGVEVLDSLVRDGVQRRGVKVEGEEDTYQRFSLNMAF